MQTGVPPHVSGGDEGAPGDCGVDNDTEREVRDEDEGVEGETKGDSYGRHLVTEAHSTEREVGAAKGIRREGRYGEGGEARHHEGADLEGQKENAQP